MRFGNWRGAAFAIAVTAALAASLTGSARAGCFHYDIPRLVEAVDVNTGGPYFAPPVPYGCYAKDHGGAILGGVGLVKGGLMGLLHPGILCKLCGGKGCGECSDPCGGCGGKGCGACGGRGFLNKHGHGGGFGHGHGGDPCGACGGAGCGVCRSWANFHGTGDCGQGDCGHEHGGRGGCKLGHGCKTGHGLKLVHGGNACGSCGGKGCGVCSGHASTVAPTGQGVPFATSQCGSQGCSIVEKHSHRRHGRACGSCGGAGRGCGACGGLGFLQGGMGGGMGNHMCAGCHGKGCGACGGLGFFRGQGGDGAGDPCGSCGGKGCGACGGKGFLGGLGCKACGGAGCGLCGKGKALLGLPHKVLGLPHALIGKICHKGEVKYFVGAGGPVPITPGYVPYVVTTRSPRDFLAFPPFVDTVP